ncbi:nucleoside-diphosphate sugar epimerase/dehydratase [Methylophaga sp.]|uniref:nucleoside-diphosphate sugar epimerase/dehydratase n=1 Tax=Methylophaga sp. TaxID=2024840 RepID=UPI0014017300|nr:nucleoside-diphosphate sugar epimerase/dehydratase [Methylophaga sp.]MTI64672.1 polysaccharide biosynthesis protein [Methylophaga sp.]
MKQLSVFTSLGQWFLNCSRKVKRIISISVDTLAVIVALWLAFSLRLGEFYSPPAQQLWIFLLAPAIAVPIFVKFGLYRAVIRYIGIDALWAISRAVLLFTLVFAVVVLTAGDLAGLVPRTVYGINAVIVMLFVGGSRMLARWLFTHSQQQNWAGLQTERFVPPVLIYGAGQAGAQLVAMLKMSNQMRPVAFIDDDKTLTHQQINGLTVYPFEKLIGLIERYQVRDILLAIPSATRRRRSEILQRLEKFPVHVRTLPDLMDIAEGKIEVSDIQEVDIGDLLGREPVAPDPALLHSNITDKVVMVTGAGGSIGSELCRQIMLLAPKALVLFEISEFSLYQIEKELEKLSSTVPLIPVLGSVLNQNRVESVCQHFQVQTIYHAAAYKHVPIVERNTNEGIRNNVFGTLHSAQAAINSGVETFVLVSTDKAVRPTNTMGATKRLAELVLQALAQTPELHQKTRFTMVRFGNVLGSSGSVVPLFREQIAAGGPVTVTDPDIIRYFMTIPEAAELVIQAGALGQGGDVFVLDMGEPVKILELARRMVHLSGFSIRDESNPDGDIAIEFTGLRPGEKLYEELLIGDNVTETAHPKIMRAEETVIPWQTLQPTLQAMSQANETDDSALSRNLLLSTIDGFKPQCDLNDWLQSELPESEKLKDHIRE